jgi:hypothetical protein
MAQLDKTTENNSLLVAEGPFIYYVSTALDGWVGSDIGPFCLLTNNAYIVGGWVRNPHNMLT